MNNAYCTYRSVQLLEGREASSKGRKDGPVSKYNIAIVIFEAAEEQDVVGPYECMAWATSFEKYVGQKVKTIREPQFESVFGKQCFPQQCANIFTVAATTAPLHMSSGMTFVADHTFDDPHLPEPDILIVPGGHGAHGCNGSYQNLIDNGTLPYIQRVGRSPRTKHIVSVCTGAFLLAEAGLLNGTYAMTYENMQPTFRQKYPQIKHVPNTPSNAKQNFIWDGRFITSNGPCSGLVSCFKLIEILTDADYKDLVKELLSYNAGKTTGLEVIRGRVKTCVV